MHLSYGTDHGCMTLITLSVWQNSGTSILSAQLHATIPNFNKNLSDDSGPTDIALSVQSQRSFNHIRNCLSLILTEILDMLAQLQVTLWRAKVEN